MANNHGSGPTPALALRALLTTGIEIPGLSRRRGEPVRFLIRVVAREEWMQIMESWPCLGMDDQERLAYISSLPSPDRWKLVRSLEILDERLIMLSVLAPRITPKAEDDPETIPVELLQEDRPWLATRIMEFSGLGATPWIPRETTDQAGEVLSQDAFRGAVEAGVSPTEKVGSADVADAPPAAG